MTACCETETMLTLSETSFTTQASSLLMALTETGSTPTGISAMRIGFFGLETSNTERRLSGVFTANKREPSGERRTGDVCLASKLTNVCAASGDTAIKSMSAAKRRAIWLIRFIALEHEDHIQLCAFFQERN